MQILALQRNHFLENRAIFDSFGTLNYLRYLLASGTFI